MPMANPCHPGEIVKYECLEPLGLTVTKAANGLGVTRQALSNVINGKGWGVGGYGDPVFEGVRLDAGDLAGNADGLRSVAGPGQGQGDQGRPIRRAEYSLAGVGVFGDADCAQGGDYLFPAEECAELYVPDHSLVIQDVGPG